MVGINLAEYTTLAQYGVLAGVRITGSSGTTTVNSGYWHAPIVTPALTAGTSPSGQVGPNQTSIDAFLELDRLIVDITTYTNSLTGGSVISETDPIFLPNISYVGAGLIFTGRTITFDGQGNSNSQFFIRANSFRFLVGCQFVLNNGAQACNIYWLSNPASGNGEFTVTDPLTPVPGIIITEAQEQIATSSSNFTRSRNIDGHIYSKTEVTFTTEDRIDVNTTTCPIITDNNFIICYMKGTLILTKQGLVPIENIKAGHSVVTKGKIYRNSYINPNDKIKIEPVMWISKFRVTNLNSKSRPICIKKDALGKNYPFQDLYVSPGHSLLLDSKMVLAKDLVNGRTIYQDKECENVEYYHLECDRHSAIFANGVLSESFFEANNRHVFENSIRLPSNFNLKKMLSLR